MRPVRVVRVRSSILRSLQAVTEAILDTAWARLEMGSLLDSTPFLRLGLLMTEPVDLESPLNMRDPRWGHPKPVSHHPQRFVRDTPQQPGRTLIRLRVCPREQGLGLEVIHVPHPGQHLVPGQAGGLRLCTRDICQRLPLHQLCHFGQECLVPQEYLPTHLGPRGGGFDLFPNKLLVALLSGFLRPVKEAEDRRHLQPPRDGLPTRGRPITTPRPNLGLCVPNVLARD